MENLELLTTSLEHKFDIIVLSETWIANNNESNTENLALQGYQNYIGTSGRSIKEGCGFLYLKNYLLILERASIFLT